MVKMDFMAVVVLGFAVFSLLIRGEKGEKGDFAVKLLKWKKKMLGKHEA